MIVARPKSPRENDLLHGYEWGSLKLVGDDGKELARFPAPSSGWTHDALEAIVRDFHAPLWDAFLDDQWIGSSEV